MSHFSYRVFERHLFWGCRLYHLRDTHGARGFRGRAKGQGFRAHLKTLGIAPRQAYRLIEFYEKVQAIWDRVHVSNMQVGAFVDPDQMIRAMCQDMDDEHSASNALTKQEVAAMEALIARKRKAMCDKNTVTNAVVDDEGKPLPSLEDAAQVRAELDDIGDNDSVTDESA